MNWYKLSQNNYDCIPEKNKGGDCFTEALNYIVEEGIVKGSNDLLLVHAIIRPLMGPLAGIEFGHAWIEKGNKIIDTSRNREVYDKQTYYILGGLIETSSKSFTIKEERINRYSIEDAKKMISEHGYCGPWENKFDNFVLDNEE